MRRATQKSREEFVGLIVSHATGPTGIGLQDERARISAAQRLLRYGATLGRIAETECNSPDYPALAWRLPEAERLAYFKRIDERYQRELDRLAAKEERIRAKVEKLCATIGCKPVFQGDPRGNTLKIQVPDGYTNDWGREGICVPTA